MSEIVALNRAPLDIHSDIGRAFIQDAVRAGEGILSDAELLETYELSSADLQALAASKAVGKAIREERNRRVRSGLAAREAAAKAFVKSPGILDQIQTNAESPKHRIDAIRELRATAHGGSDGEGTSKGELFSIVINLGSDHIERHEFDITPKPPQLEGEVDGEW